MMVLHLLVKTIQLNCKKPNSSAMRHRRELGLNLVLGDNMACDRHQAALTFPPNKTRQRLMLQSQPTTGDVHAVAVRYLRLAR